MSNSAKRGLGRGLSDLLGEYEMEPVAAVEEADSDAQEHLASITYIPLENLRPNPTQPRRDFDESKIAELAQSIRSNGMIQPVIVRPADTAGTYEIIAGERRWRAAQKAQLHNVPTIISEADEAQMFALALVENIQREDLNAAEEAEGYQMLMQKHGYTQNQIAQIVGCSRSHVANMIRLLSAPAKILDYLRAGKLSAGHVRALLGTTDKLALAEELIAKGLNVRQAEKLAGDSAGSKEAKSLHKQESATKDADTLALEADIEAALGLKVDILHKPGGNGKISIYYKSMAELDGLCQKLI